MARLALSPEIGLDSVSVEFSLRVPFTVDGKAVDLAALAAEALREAVARRWIKSGAHEGEYTIVAKEPPRNATGYRPLGNFLRVEAGTGE